MASWTLKNDWRWPLDKHQSRRAGGYVASVGRWSTWKWALGPDARTGASRVAAGEPKQVSTSTEPADIDDAGHARRPTPVRHGLRRVKKSAEDGLSFANHQQLHQRCMRRGLNGPGTRPTVDQLHNDGPTRPVEPERYGIARQAANDFPGRLMICSTFRVFPPADHEALGVPVAIGLPDRSGHRPSGMTGAFTCCLREWRPPAC